MFPVVITEAGLYTIEIPFLESLLSNSVLLRLSILVEMGPESLWIFLVCCCEAQLKDSLIKTH